MIIDKLDNINFYSNIPEPVLDFLKNLDGNNITLGKTIIDDSSYVNIEKYKTKPIKDAKYETHDNYADIQLLINGREKIYLSERAELTILEPYNVEKDITFYSDYVAKDKYVTLDGTNFVMLYPHEAHAPQISCSEDTSEEVIKVVVKIGVK